MLLLIMFYRFKDYDAKQSSDKGLKMILSNSWYLSGEIATLSLFSDLVPDEQKSKLFLSMKKERSSSHLLKKLLLKLVVCVFLSFFETAKIQDSFLIIPVKDWPEMPSYKKVAIFAKNLVCVNDVAKQALIKDFYCATKNEEQKFLLQIVEMHRKSFKQYNRLTLLEM
ncbi:hypothetical protein AVEN_221173-1 [Araneus ventricosus]|uniref:Uncharacterized protein n=1 Tax=Araneus ventricosus TaxID=182803 RepID=A0A4Y2DEQ1_ARAVE|nr:hypothetical protein AVEN_221173-1 [Araneus ventricosus]